MQAIGSRVKEALGMGPRDLSRLFYRKFVHRNIVMGRYEVRAGDSIAPASAPSLVISRLDPSRFAEAAAGNPYFGGSDLEEFRSRNSVCMVAMDGTRIAASTWMTQGEVYVHELHRTVSVPRQEHFSCRTYVDPEYQGRSLMGHMIHAYAMSVEEDDLLWGLVYEWNMASIRSLEKLGWRRTGRYWTRFLLGRAVHRTTLHRELATLPGGA